MNVPTERSPWFAIGGVFSIYLCFGMAIAAMAPLVDEISGDLDLSRGAMGSILGAWALIYVGTAIPASTVVDRIGLRRALAIGGATIALSLALRALATGPVVLFLAVAVFGVGGPLVSVGAPKLVSAMFSDDRRRLPTGLTVAAPGVGSTIALAITTPVLMPAVGERWRAIMVIYAVASVIAVGIWWATSSDLPADAQRTRRTNRADFRRLLRLTSVRGALAISVPMFFVSHSLNNWLVEILTDAGQSDTSAGYLASLSTAFAPLGALLIARLVPAARRSLALTMVFAWVAGSVAALGSLGTAWLAILLAVLGVVRSGTIPLLFLVLMDDPDVDIDDMGAATGMFFATGEVGAFAGPWVVGAIADRADGFGPALTTLAAVAVAAGLLALRLPSGHVANT